MINAPVRVSISEKDCAGAVSEKRECAKILFVQDLRVHLGCYEENVLEFPRFYQGIGHTNSESAPGAYRIDVEGKSVGCSQFMLHSSGSRRLNAVGGRCGKNYPLD